MRRSGTVSISAADLQPAARAAASAGGGKGAAGGKGGKGRWRSDPRSNLNPHLCPLPPNLTPNSNP